MTDRLQLVSHFPGRLRVRASTFRVLPDVANDVAQRVREEPGVKAVTIGPTTGSLVIEYEPAEVSLARIVRLLVRVGGLHGLEVDAMPDHSDGPNPGQRIRAALHLWDRHVLNNSAGKLDLRITFPALLAATGIGSFIFGKRRTPEWYDFVFWSLTMFFNLNPVKPPQVPAVDSRAR